MPRGEAREAKADYRRLGEEERTFQGWMQPRAEESRGLYNRALGSYMSGAERVANPELAVRMGEGFEGYLGQAGQRLSGIDVEQMYGPAMQALQQFQSHPGYTQAEQQGMKVAAAAPIQAAYRAAAEQERNRSAAMGQGTTAGGALATKLAQQRGLALSPALAGLQEKFGIARREDEQYGIGAMSELTKARLAGQVGAAGAQAGLAETAGTQRQREVENIPGLFQFPMQLGQTGEENFWNQWAKSKGRQGQNLGYMTQRANQPGIGSQLALAGVQGIAGGIKVPGLGGGGGSSGGGN